LVSRTEVVEIEILGGLAELSSTGMVSLVFCLSVNSNPVEATHRLINYTTYKDMSNFVLLPSKG
jgi:hypothetical protein